MIRGLRGRVACAGALLVAAALSGTPAMAKPAKLIFGAEAAPSAGPAAPYGSYARGCLAGAVALPETGPAWQAMRLDRNRNWGHPAMIAFIERLAQRAQAVGWRQLYVGDISQPRGGPMNGGHRSHQIGLDADIWLRIPGAAPLSRSEREAISSQSVVGPDRMAVNGAWRPEHRALIRLAAEDPEVARIFVNAAIKKALCEAAPPGERGWLHKVRAWWGHDSHMHVRLRCPAGATACEPQDPPPPGDGCGAELAWWFTDEALHPKPSGKLRAELTLDDLPTACRSVLR